jgi:hypothetical protein
MSLGVMTVLSREITHDPRGELVPEDGNYTHINLNDVADAALPNGFRATRSGWRRTSRERSRLDPTDWSSSRRGHIIPATANWSTIRGSTDRRRW